MELPQLTQEASKLMRHIINGREQGFHPQFCIGGTADTLQEILAQFILLSRELKAYKAKNERMLEALKPFSDNADAWDEYEPNEQLVEPFNEMKDERQSDLKVSDLRNARAALTNEKEPK